MLQLLHISTQPCHIPLTIKPKVSLCCVQEGKCWDISPIYRRGEISVNITKKSLIYRLEAINRRFFSLICCHKKKSSIFLQFIGDISTKRKRPPLPRLPAPLPRLPFPSQSPAQAPFPTLPIYETSTIPPAPLPKPISLPKLLFPSQRIFLKKN